MANPNLSSSLEDYLEAIYFICDNNPDQVAHANEIARHLGVGKSSVSWALNQLSEKKLINYAPYEVITLTGKGLIIAQQLARRHREITRFLVDVLTLDPQIAEDNACRMEHILDREVLEKMIQAQVILGKTPKMKRNWHNKLGQGGLLSEKAQSHTEETGDDIKAISSGANASAANASAEVASTEIESAEVASTEVESGMNASAEDATGAVSSGAYEPSKALPKTSKVRDRDILLRLKDVMEESARPLSEAQLAVARAFMANEKHQTIDDILKNSRKTSSGIDRDTVEKTMQILCEHKIAHSFVFNDQIVYEHFHPESHHDHFLCVKCGAIVEFFDPRIEHLQRGNAEEADFRPLHHTLNIYGVCGDCIKLEKNIRTLCECMVHETVKIIRIVANRKSQRRITEMGLVVGATVEILNNNCAGDNLIILANESRVMLDHDTAQKIRVVSTNIATRGLQRQCRRGPHHHLADRLSS